MGQADRLLYTMKLLLFGILLVGLVRASVAQPTLSGKVSGGFQAPTSTDSDGRRHLVRGESMEPRGDGVLDLTGPRVTRFNPDDTPDMFIESAQCLYNTKAGVASSVTNLQVRTADGRFSLQGIGWHWDLSGSLLTISNQVIANVQKAALAGSGTSTNQKVQITSGRFQQEGDAATFLDNVVVKDGEDTLRCDKLNIQFVKPGGARKIEAIGNFDLVQRETRIQAGRAIYDVKENTIRILEQPKWNVSRREGSAETVFIDRTAETLAADGSVYMKLPLTNLVLTTTPTDRSAPTNPPAGDRFVEIRSDRFEYSDERSNRLAQAVYVGNVQASQAGAILTCKTLAATFGSSNRLTRLKALEEVVISSAQNKVSGREADYDVENDKMTISGDPRWQMDQMTGRSETLVFLPKTKEILALKNVELTVTGRSLGALVSATNQTAATNSPLKISAESLAHSERVSVFNNDVVVADERGTIECAQLTLVSGQTNELQRIIAEKDVVLRQPNLVALGNRAEYEQATGLVRLTGDPELLAPGKSLRAESFVIDRNRNTFSVSPGKYRIQLQLSKNRDEQR
jgi:lipopolysaccharide export system protein LptA